MSMSDFAKAVAAELAVEPENIEHIDLEGFYIGGMDPFAAAQSIIAADGN